MRHIQHSAKNSVSDLEPSFHVYMASAPIVSSAPDPPEPNTMWNWSTSSSIIKELLNLSSAINLEGEITPVEAWHRLRQHAEFWKFDRRAINSLKDELSQHVSCFGYVLSVLNPSSFPREVVDWLLHRFGAVLDELAFHQTLNKHLANAYTSHQARWNISRGGVGLFEIQISMLLWFIGSVYLVALHSFVYDIYLLTLPTNFSRWWMPNDHVVWNTYRIKSAKRTPALHRFRLHHPVLSLKNNFSWLNGSTVRVKGSA